VWPMMKPSNTKVSIETACTLHTIIFQCHTVDSTEMHSMFRVSSGFRTEVTKKRIKEKVCEFLKYTENNYRQYIIAMRVI